MFKFLEGGCFPRRQSEETPSIAMVCSPQLCLISYFLILSGALRREGLEQSEGKGGILPCYSQKRGQVCLRHNGKVNFVIMPTCVGSHRP